jgi:hypothetical protein
MITFCRFSVPATVLLFVTATQLSAEVHPDTVQAERHLQMRMISLGAPANATGESIVLITPPMIQSLQQSGTSVAAASSPQPMVRGTIPDHTVRSAGILTVAGAAAFGVIWLLPEDISKWDRTAGPDGFRPGLATFRQAYTRPPVWDRDGWVVNYVGHPVSGMQTYLLERNHGSSRTRSFVFSTAASIGWEYGIEAWAEQPSIQDLLITSTAGSVLGELSYRATHSMLRDGLSRREKVVLTLINPIHVLQHGYR